MIYVFIIAFALLLALNYTVSRNVLYPPVVFCAAWMTSLIGLVFANFYAVSLETLTVFLVGALAFSIGGLFAFQPNPQPKNLKGARAALDIALIVCAIGLPIFWFGLGEIDLQSIRQEAVEAASSSSRSFTLLGNLIVLSSFVALAMHAETNVPRWRAYLAIIIAISYTALTGSKGGAKLILALMFISAMKGASVKTMAVGSVLFVTLFGLGIALVNFAYLDLDFSMDTFRFIGEIIENYWLGSLVAFEAIVKEPNVIASNHDPSRFFLETANGFGMNYEIPSIHSPFTPISQWMDSNTYTIYFSYFKDYGWIGVIVFMTAIGNVVTTVYHAARKGSQIAIVFFGVLSVATVMSIQAESFLLGLNGYLKLLAFLFFVYYIATLRVFHTQ